MDCRENVWIGSTFADRSPFGTDADRFHAVKATSNLSRPGSEPMTGIAKLDARHWINPSDIACRAHATAGGAGSVVQWNGIRLAPSATRHSNAVSEVTQRALESVLTCTQLSALAGVPLAPVDWWVSVRHRILEEIAYLFGRERPRTGSRARGVFETVAAERGVPAG